MNETLRKTVFPKDIHPWPDPHPDFMDSLYRVRSVDERGCSRRIALLCHIFLLCYSKTVAKSGRLQDSSMGIHHSADHLYQFFLFRRSDSHHYDVYKTTDQYPLTTILHTNK